MRIETIYMTIGIIDLTAEIKITAVSRLAILLGYSLSSV
jgi:hypothetical protein